MFLLNLAFKSEPS